MDWAEDIRQLSKRAKDIDTEVTIGIRKQREEAKKARMWLDSITEEDLALFSKKVPLLTTVVGFTEEQIYRNAGNEKQLLNQTMEQLRAYVESMLQYLEDKLC